MRKQPTKFVLENFLQQSKEKYKNIEHIFLDTPQRYIDKIRIKCVKHDFIFSTSPFNHLKGNGCLLCLGKKVYSTDSFINISKIKFPNKFRYENTIFLGTKKKVIVECLEHGLISIHTFQHLNSETGCPKCYYKIIGAKRRLTVEEICDKINHHHGNRYKYNSHDIFNYKIKYGFLNIECEKHGRFSQEFNAHLRGAGCPGCCNKKISKRQTEWLDSLNIPKDNLHRNVKINISENLFYYVDGFDPINKVVYEFNGDYWHGNPTIYDPNKINKNTKKSFGFLYSKTLEKQNKLEQLGYKVISIWENDWKKQSLKK